MDDPSGNSHLLLRLMPCNSTTAYKKLSPYGDQPNPFRTLNVVKLWPLSYETTDLEPEVPDADLKCTRTCTLFMIPWSQRRLRKDNDPKSPSPPRQ